MEDLFIKASRKRLRFLSTAGNLSVEDLWNLPLDTLDKAAVAMDKKVKESQGGSFIPTKKDAIDEDLVLSLEIAKYIIATRLKEQEAKKLAKEKAEKRKAIGELIAKKEQTNLEGKSLEELQKEYDALLD